MGKLIDRFALFALCATAFYIFFLNAWHSIPLACLLAFLRLHTAASGTAQPSVSLALFYRPGRGGASAHRRIAGIGSGTPFAPPNSPKVSGYLVLSGHLTEASFCFDLYRRCIQRLESPSQRGCPGARRNRNGRCARPDVCSGIGRAVRSPHRSQNPVAHHP